MAVTPVLGEHFTWLREPNSECEFLNDFVVGHLLWRLGPGQVFCVQRDTTTSALIVIACSGSRTAGAFWIIG